MASRPHSVFFQTVGRDPDLDPVRRPLQMNFCSSFYDCCWSHPPLARELMVLRVLSGSLRDPRARRASPSNRTQSVMLGYDNDSPSYFVLLKEQAAYFVNQLVPELKTTPQGAHLLKGTKDRVSETRCDYNNVAAVTGSEKQGVLLDRNPRFRTSCYNE